MHGLNLTRLSCQNGVTFENERSINIAKATSIKLRLASQCLCHSQPGPGPEGEAQATPQTTDKQCKQCYLNRSLTRVCPHVSLERFFSRENPAAYVASNVAVDFCPLHHEISDGLGPRPTPFQSIKIWRATTASRAQVDFMGSCSPIPWIHGRISQRRACWS